MQNTLQRNINQRANLCPKELTVKMSTLREGDDKGKRGRKDLFR